MSVDASNNEYRHFGFWQQEIAAEWNKMKQQMYSCIVYQGKMQSWVAYRGDLWISRYVNAWSKHFQEQRHHGVIVRLQYSIILSTVAGNELIVITVTDCSS